MDTSTKKYAPIVLRLGLAALFLWFGLSQLATPGDWTAWVPEWATTLLHIDARTIVLLNGGFETVLAVLLVLGVYVRWVALLLGLHTVVIAFEIGYGAIAIRDVGIAIASFSSALNGEDDWSLHRKNS